MPHPLPVFYFFGSRSIFRAAKIKMIGSLQSVQNTAARIVILTKKFDHITPVLIQLHLLPVHFRILFKVLLLVYKALSGMAPLYITELLSYRTCSRTLRSTCLLYTSPSPRDGLLSRMPSSA